MVCRIAYLEMVAFRGTVPANWKVFIARPDIRASYSGKYFQSTRYYRKTIRA